MAVISLELASLRIPTPVNGIVDAFRYDTPVMPLARHVPRPRRRKKIRRRRRGRWFEPKTRHSLVGATGLVENSGGDYDREPEQFKEALRGAVNIGYTIGAHDHIRRLQRVVVHEKRAATGVGSVRDGKCT